MAIDFKIFQNYPHLKFGMSQISDGPMELAGSGSFENRKIFLERNNIRLDQVISAQLAHSENVVFVNAESAGAAVQNIDALATKTKTVALTITVADCYPVFFYAPAQETVALAHSGWRGSVSKLIANTIKVMETDPTGLLVGIGPGIGLCHFEVKNDIISQFIAYPEALEFRDTKTFVNLASIIRHQLVSAGVKPKNIEFSGDCTYCEKQKYFSYRRDKPEKVQAMVAYISL